MVRTLCSGSDNVKSVLQTSEFKIVVNGNPDSRRQVEQGSFCLRTNPNGVDLNRNWDEHWDAGDVSGMADTNPGTAPFSEPETQIFRQLTSEYMPTTFLTVHSGTLGMYMPWAYDMEHLANRNQPEMMQILKDLDKDHCQCPFGAAGREVGYSCPGTCLDWVFDNLNTPYAFAFEIYVGQGEDDLKSRWEEKMKAEDGSFIQASNHLAHPHFKDLFEKYPSSFVQLSSISNRSQEEDWECFQMFNPGTEDKYKDTIENWSQAYLDMASMTAKKLRQL